MLGFESSSHTGMTSNAYCTTGISMESKTAENLVKVFIRIIYISHWETVDGTPMNLETKVWTNWLVGNGNREVMGTVSRDWRVHCS